MGLFRLSLGCRDRPQEGTDPCEGFVIQRPVASLRRHADGNLWHGTRRQIGLGARLIRSPDIDFGQVTNTPEEIFDAAVYWGVCNASVEKRFQHALFFTVRHDQHMHQRRAPVLFAFSGDRKTRIPQ